MSKACSSHVLDEHDATLIAHASAVGSGWQEAAAATGGVTGGKGSMHTVPTHSTPASAVQGGGESAAAAGGMQGDGGNVHMEPTLSALLQGFKNWECWCSSRRHAS